MSRRNKVPEDDSQRGDQRHDETGESVPNTSEDSPMSKSAPGGGRKRPDSAATGTRMQLDELEQKRLVSNPPSPGSKHIVRRLPSINSPIPSEAQRLQLDDLEQKKLAANPPSTGAKHFFRRLSSKNSPIPSEAQRLQLDELEQKKLAANPPSPGAKHFVRRSSSGTPKDPTLNESGRMQLNDLEQKILASHVVNPGEIHAVRRPPSRGVSVGEGDAVLPYSSPGNVLSLEEFESAKLSPGESPSQRNSLRNPSQASSAASPRPSTSGLPSRRRLSLAELFHERRIAAAGMGETLRDRSIASAATRNSHRTSASRKSSKVLMDQAGRSIDLDLEFARLHAGNNVGDPQAIQLGDDDIAFTPGAVAVYTSQYDGNEDLEPDYVNPDNFDTVERAQTPRVTDSNNAETGEFSQLQEAQTQPVAIQDQPEGRHKLFPNVQRRNICIPLVIMLVLVVGVAVGVVLGAKGNGGASSNSANSTPSNESPLSLPPTPSPTFSAPSQSAQPSQKPSTAPSRTSWTKQGSIQGISFGSSVQLTNRMCAFSNTSSIRTYEFNGGQWTEVGEPVDGDLVRLSESNRIVVRAGDVLKVYDLFRGNWTQLGSDIVAAIAPTEFSISGDGSTIAVSYVSSSSRQDCQVYRFDGSSWFQFGRNIFENDVSAPAGISLSYDGRKLAIGYETTTSRMAILYDAPDSSIGEWIDDSFQLLLQGGPAVVLSNDGLYLAAAGGGRIFTYGVITHTSVGFPNAVSPQEYGFIDVHDPTVTPSIAFTNNGTTLAYAWDQNLVVVELIDNEWVDKGMWPEIYFNIDSISFSSEGRLAVGQPEGNVIEIFELLN